MHQKEHIDVVQLAQRIKMDRIYENGKICGFIMNFEKKVNVND